MASRKAHDLEKLRSIRRTATMSILHMTSFLIFYTQHNRFGNSRGDCCIWQSVVNVINIIEKSISELKPYSKNAKKHPQSQIDKIAKSIQLTKGLRQPIVIDKDGVIICGHGRFLAVQQLGYKTVPCELVTDLTDDEIKAYRLIDNKIQEGEYDLDMQLTELSEINIDIDMGDFGFDVDDMQIAIDEKEEKHQEDKEATQEAKSNILNLAYSQFPGVGRYDIPEIMPIHMDEIGEIEEWIGFNYVLSDKSPENKAVHFFVDDYQFERVWNNPLKYIDKLKQYKAVCAPDFSPYGDMPLATQIFNHYRKHWVARLWQENGIKVIPTIRASTDKRSLLWYLDGEPQGGVVCIDNKWTSGKIEREYFLNHEYKNMKDKLNPQHIFIYGHEMTEITDKNVTFIKSFAEERWNNG